jgi:transcriptional regulator with XRE-family HTH domain
MPYSEKIREVVNNAPASLGTDLGRWALLRDISMKQISQITGASRQTVYNWFTGATDVTPAYQERVAKVIEVLRHTSQTDDAWRILCTTFDLRL